MVQKCQRITPAILEDVRECLYFSMKVHLVKSIIDLLHFLSKNFDSVNFMSILPNEIIYRIKTVSNVTKAFTSITKYKSS